MSVYIGFSLGKGSWFTKLILWGTRAPIKISHALVLLDVPIMADETPSRRLTIGAESDGVRWIPEVTFNRKNEIKAVLRLNVANARLAEGLAWLEQTYGDAAYDYMSAGAIGFMHRLHFIWKWFGRFWRKRLKREKVMCTELVIRLLQRLGLFANLDPELTDPLDLLTVLAHTPKYFELVSTTQDVKQFLAKVQR